ncbi:KICSTOR complex protein ITFG2-like [Watersipora subatra]|uniref:KICSTOR complex protein ITFG2-like n=1 Tax=Watersipora subatra TaxID=2589382 RepID=UPI00355AD551
MRTISFVERLELEFHGPWNLCQQAIALGDVDNDGSNELAVGTVSGHLLVYKGSEPKAWKSCRDLGTITCVAVGDICNSNTNTILVLSADGWCNVFHVSPQGEEAFIDEELRPIHRQHLSANSKVLLMGDIDGDGKIEIAVGFSDRIVRTYRWYPYTNTKGGEIAFFNKWSLDAQIGSISLKPGEDNLCDLVASQPGGTFAILKSNGEVIYDKQPSKSSQARNDCVYTEMVGNVRTEDNRNYYALTTLDGTIMLMDYEGHKIYEIHVDHQLFGLTKLDITGDGVEEVIVCSWDGQTYIVNSKQQIAKFQFDEPTAAFIAGHYSVESKNEACLIYVTSSGRIYIYHNIKLAHVQTVSLIEALEGNEKVKQFMDNMARLGLDSTREGKKKLYQWCLYGRKPRLCQE